MSISETIDSPIRNDEDAFYSAMPVFRGFANLMDPSLYRPVPDGWLIGVADILFGNHRDLSLVLGREFSGDGEDRRREAADAGFAAFPNLQLIASTARHTVTADHHRIAARVDLHHLPDLLGQGHPSQQIGDTLLNG